MCCCIWYALKRTEASHTTPSNKKCNFFILSLCSYFSVLLLFVLLLLFYYYFIIVISVAHAFFICTFSVAFTCFFLLLSSSFLWRCVIDTQTHHVYCIYSLSTVTHIYMYVQMRKHTSVLLTIVHSLKVYIFSMV